MYEQLTTYILDHIRVNDGQLQTILSYFKPIALKKNEVISIAGHLSRRMYFVNKGCLRVYFIKPEGAEVTRRFAFENSFSTSLVSFISGGPLLEYTQAVEATELLAISRNDFYYLLDQVPAWEKFYRGYLEGAYVTNTNRLQSFITLDATERYRQLLEESPHIVLRLPNKLVANYLNISQEALSRLKSKI
ncbi:Crp/Fnr family transcriptional regulator [Flavitalea flava]